MSSSRNLKDNLLKYWLYFRDNDSCSLTNAKDKKHIIKFDEFSDIILEIVFLMKLTLYWEYKIIK